MSPIIAMAVADDRFAEHYRTTRSGIIERMADPYLTDHDRWVLQQFARFLDGSTPDPDPRVERPRPERPLFARVTRSTL
jgi:hypothetical protein